MSIHYETAIAFINRLDRGDLGQSVEDRASALAMVLAGALAATPPVDDDRIRRHARSIIETCEHAYGDEATVKASRDAARWSHGAALEILRLLGGANG
jgi:hypothetical protein